MPQHPARVLSLLLREQKFLQHLARILYCVQQEVDVGVSVYVRVCIYVHVYMYLSFGLKFYQIQEAKCHEAYWCYGREVPRTEAMIPWDLLGWADTWADGDKQQQELVDIGFAMLPVPLLMPMSLTGSICPVLASQLLFPQLLPPFLS